MSEKRRRALNPPPPEGVRLIRKYGNRRLYDTGTSRYVTLGDLVGVFGSEEDVKVIDAVTGEDITKKVLAQAILFEEDRRRAQILPIQLLRALLRHHLEPSQLSERKVAKFLAESGAGGRAERRPSPPGEADDLKRRLRALESQMGKARRG